jgi:hypothetical protein
MIVKKLDNQPRKGSLFWPSAARNRGQTVNVVLPCLNTQTPKMPHLAILGNTIRLRALHNRFPGE